MVVGLFLVSENISNLIIDTKANHLEAVSNCHKLAFPSSLSTKMGTDYLCKMYNWYLSTNKTFLFHIDSNGDCLGYCGGMVIDGTLPTGSASSMIQFSFYSAIVSIIKRPWLIFHVEMRKKYSLIWRNIKNKLGIMKYQHPLETITSMKQSPYVGLVVIAVSPAYQGKRFSSTLLKEFERKAIDDFGIHKLQLSVLVNNYKAIRTYEHNGWIRYRQEGNSLLMVKELQTDVTHDIKPIEHS